MSGSWRRSWVVAVPLWLAVHVAYLAVTYVHRILAGPAAGGSGLHDWVRWDAGRYLEIAEKGYEAVPHQAAFFPFYPWLCALLDPVLPGDLVVSAMVVSNLAGLGAMVLLHRVVAEEFGDSVAGRTIFYLIAFPSAFFLAAPFSHSLFLLLATGFLYALHHRRWWPAGLLGALASGTRPVGVLLLAPFVFEYLRVHWPMRRPRFDAAAALLVPVGAVAYVAYCWAALGDPLAYTHAQAGTWDKALTWPGQTLTRAAWELVTDPTYGLAIDLFSAVLAIGAIAACFVGPWALRPDQWYLPVYAAAILVLPLCVPSGTAPVQSLARYLLDIAVVFAVLARAAGSRTAERLYVLPAFAAQCAFLFMYLDNVWTF